MRVVGLWIVFLGVCSGVSGCAQGGATLTRVSDPTRRVETMGLSVLPPQGNDWFRVLPPQLDPDAIIEFVKVVTPHSKTHTVMATLRGGKLFNPEGTRVERLEKLAQVYSEDKGRERTISFNIVPDQTLPLDCLRYDGIFEDRGVPGYRGTIFIFDLHGIVCLHPHYPVSIDISYSQRRLQAEAPLPLEVEGEPFLKSLVILE